MRLRKAMIGVLEHGFQFQIRGGGCWRQDNRFQIEGGAGGCFRKAELGVNMVSNPDPKEGCWRVVKQGQNKRWRVYSVYFMLWKKDQLIFPIWPCPMGGQRPRLGGHCPPLPPHGDATGFSDGVKPSAKNRFLCKLLLPLKWDLEED